MRNDAVKLFYSKPEVFKQDVEGYLKNVLNHYKKFAGYSMDGCMDAWDRWADLWIGVGWTHGCMDA